MVRPQASSTHVVAASESFSDRGSIPRASTRGSGLGVRDLGCVLPSSEARVPSPFRAGVSVASNIAEGHARSLGDYLRHLLISNGSLTEMETQFVLSARLGFIPPEQAESLLQACDQVGRMLGGLRKSLRARRVPGARAWGSGIGDRG